MKKSTQKIIFIVSLLLAIRMPSLQAAQSKTSSHENEKDNNTSQEIPQKKIDKWFELAHSEKDDYKPLIPHLKQFRKYGILNKRDKETGQTALIISAAKGHQDKFHCLLELGADSEIEDKSNKKAMDYVNKLYTKDNQDSKDTKKDKENRAKQKRMQRIYHNYQRRKEWIELAGQSGTREQLKVLVEKYENKILNKLYMIKRLL